MTTQDAFVLIAEDIDATQRTLMHNFIKKNAENWWHQMSDVWVVVGQSAAFWRDNLRSFTLPKTSILVLALKQGRGGRWATHGVIGGPWFNEHLPGGTSTSKAVAGAAATAAILDKLGKSSPSEEKI